MSKSKDPRKQYLKQRGNQWFLNFPIPRELRPHFLTAGGKPMDHMVLTTGTGDLDEAHRRKFGMIHKIQAEFTQRARELRGTLPADLLTAKAFATDMQAASNSDNHELAETIGLLVTDHAERIHDAGGGTRESLQRARSFTRIAHGEQTLLEAFEDWMAAYPLPDRTQSKYRTAIAEFVGCLGGLPLLDSMNQRSALLYVDWLNREARSQRTKAMIPLAYNTKRDRIAALSAFWNGWLKPRGKSLEPVNPWSMVKVTETPTSSSIKWDSIANTGKPKRREALDEGDLIAILNAPGPRQGGALRYTKRTLMELFCLGLLTGARPDEVCSLTLENIRECDQGYQLHFTETKNGTARRIPVVHPVAVAIVKRRIAERTAPTAQLFDEFKSKEGHSSLAELVLRSLGRHLERASGLPGGAVPYCTRHTFATLVGNMPDVKDHAFKHYIGHKQTSITDKHYRAPTTEILRDIAKAVRYSERVEALMWEQLELAAI